MATTVLEKYKGRRMDATSAEVVYLVFDWGGGLSDEDAFTAVYNSAPGYEHGIPVANIDVRNELVQDKVWEVAVIYSSTNPVVFTQSTVDYEFSFQAPSEHIYQSLETIDARSATGAVNKNKYGGAINVKGDPPNQEVEGIDLPPGNATSVWVYQPLHTTITDSYQVGVESIMGGVNNFAFKNRAAGTMRFIGCDGGARFSLGAYPKWSIRFAFQFSPNQSNLQLGGITIPFKGGHHLLWARYETEIDESGDAADDTVMKKPKYIFVERVFPTVNLGALGI